MSSDNPDNGGRSNEKFTKLRDIAVLLSKIHPDKLRQSSPGKEDVGDKINIKEGSPEYWGEELMKILTGLKATDQLENWQPDLWAKIISPDKPTYRFVRKLGDAEPELSPPVRLPRTPYPFLIALDAYTQGTSWIEVESLLGKEMVMSEDQQKILEVETEISKVRTFEEAGNVAKRIHETFKEGNRRNSMIGLLTTYLSFLLRGTVSKCKDLPALEKARVEVNNFFETPNGKYFRKVRILDVLDHRALDLGKELLSRAMTQDEVAKAMEAIRNHPFEFAFVYEQPFSETRDDAIAKIDFLEKLRSKRSEAGLDELRKEVDAHQFTSMELADHYRKQIVEFIERKRNVYWPKKPRSTMPAE